MALQIKYVYEKHFEYCGVLATGEKEVKVDYVKFPAAYVKIEKIKGDKQEIEIQVNIYSDNAKITLLDRKEYSFVPSVATGSTNFIQQGYEYLKNLPEYEGAVDC